MRPAQDALRLREFEESAQDGFLSRNNGPPNHPNSTAARARNRPAQVQRSSRRASDHPAMAQEMDDLALGPASIVPIGLGQKGAVAAVCSLKQRDVWVGPHLFSCLR